MALFRKSVLFVPQLLAHFFKKLFLLECPTCFLSQGFPVLMFVVLFKKTTCMKKSFWLLLLGATGLLASCKKDNNGSPTDLIIGKWSPDKIILTESGGGKTEIDTTYKGDAEPCDQDNFIAFLAGGKGYNSPGDKLCNGQTGTVDSFGYALLDNNSKLTITSAGSSSNTLNIQTLNGSSLVLNQTEQDSTKTYSVTVYLSKLP